jgi:uncharacterized protein (DUF1015 family)
MAEIIPIRGIRYATTAGPMSKLVTPPYDVINEITQERFYQLHPYNIIRLEYGKTYPSDHEKDNRYTRAAADFLSWQQIGILFKEPAPALYWHEQKFIHNGELKTRRGLICGVKLEPYEKGVILPHEETLPKHKADRLALMRACRANFSPIFGLYADEEKIVEQLLAKESNRSPDISFLDENGIRHSMWVITKQEIIGYTQQALAEKRIYLADGHHRYETALNYRNERREKEGPQERKCSSDYVMMSLVNLYDPGLLILPPHRLIRHIRNLDKEKLLKDIQESFFLEKFPLTPDRENFKEFIKRLKERGKITRQKIPWPESQLSDKSLVKIEPPVYTNRHQSFGLYEGGNELYLLTLKDKAFLSLPTKENYSLVRRNLDVSVLHTLILEKLLGIGDEQLVGGDYVTYTEKEREALAAVEAGEYQLALFLNPTKIEEIIAVAAQGEKMPQKSTYFYPKLITGLVINPLE